MNINDDSSYIHESPILIYIAHAQLFDGLLRYISVLN